MRKTYRILQTSIAVDESSKLKILDVKALEINYLKGVFYGSYSVSAQATSFSFLLGSAIANDIQKDINIPLELDLDEFRIDSVDYVGSSEIIQIYSHREFFRAKWQIENRSIHYEELFKLSKEKLNEIPTFLYEHLYTYGLEGDSTEKINYFRLPLYPKKLIPKAKVNFTLLIIKKIADLIKRFGTIDDLRHIIEQDFSRTGFNQNWKTELTNGNSLEYFSLPSLSFYPLEQKIVYCSLLTNNIDRNNRIIEIRCSKGFWEEFLFVCVNCSNTTRINYGLEKNLTLHFEFVTTIFKLTDNNLYSVFFV